MAQILIFSLLISALYALVAAGFTLIFGVARVFNLAHGAFLMVGAYAAYLANGIFGWNIYLATAFAVLFTAAFAVAIYKGLVRYIISYPVVTLMATLAFSLLLEQLILVIPFFGPNPRPLDSFIPGAIALSGTQVPSDRLVGFAVSWVCFLAFGLFMQWTKLGKAVEATSQDRLAAALVGIDAERIYTIVFMISGALAALAGIFFVSWGSLTPSLWREPMIISFAIVIFGGLGSITGSLISAYLIGFLETFTTYTPMLGPSWVGMPSLALLLIILMLRPQGLLGRGAE